MARIDRQANLLRHRVQLLLSREKAHGYIKSRLDLEKSRNQPKKPKIPVPLKRVLPQKDPQYYINKGILGPDHRESLYFEVDEVSGLPYNLGFDSDVQGCKEDTGQVDMEQDYHMIARELGFRTIEEARSKVEVTDVTQRREKVRKRLYAKRDLKADTYSDIEFRKDPRTKARKPTDIEEFYPIDMSDEETTEEGNAEDIEKYLSQKLEEETLLGTPPALADSLQNQDVDLEADEEYDPTTLTDYGSIYWDEKTKKFLELVSQHQIIRPATKRVKELLRLHSESNRRPERIFSVPGKQDTLFWKEKMKLFTHSTPTLKDVMREVDETIEAGPRALQMLLKRDKYEGNYHFKPKYLDKDFHNDDFGWAYEHLKNVQTLSTGIVYGELNQRINASDLITLENAKRTAHHEPFEISKENQDAVTIFGLIKKDPYYKHYLDNHLKFWGERLSKDALSLTARPDGARTKAFDLIPWEAILVSRNPDLGDLGRRVRKPDSNDVATGHGSRKTAKALAYVKPGIGRITVNGKNIINYFTQLSYRTRLIRPFGMTGTTCEFDVKLIVHGGGSSAQSQACMLAISRAIAVYGKVFEKILRDHKELKANPRQVERKKTSLYKARKGYTFVKR